MSGDFRRFPKTDEDVQDYRRFPKRNSKIFDYGFVLIFTCERYRDMAARRCEISLRVLKNINSNEIQNHFTFRFENFTFRFDLLCNHSNGDLFTGEDIMFSRESSPGISLVFM